MGFLDGTEVRDQADNFAPQMDLLLTRNDCSNFVPVGSLFNLELASQLLTQTRIITDVTFGLDLFGHI